MCGAGVNSQIPGLGVGTPHSDPRSRFGDYRAG